MGELQPEKEIAPVLLENISRINQAERVEFYRCIWGKWIQKYYILAVFFLLLSVGTLLLSVNMTLLQLEVTVFVMILGNALRYHMILPISHAKRECRQRQYLYGTVGQVRYRFSADWIETYDENSCGKERYRVEDVQAIQESAHLILIGLPGNSWMTLEKSNFTLGTQDDLWDYLHTYCPQAEWLNRR